MDEITIPKLKFMEPKRNLPGRGPRTRTAEDRMTYAFARTYLDQQSLIHRKASKSVRAAAREIPVNGFGIADLVCVAWDQSRVSCEGRLQAEEFSQLARPTIRAFEVKLSSWRKALRQANRYRFFSDSSIVVLPLAACEVARKHLDTFRTIKVGLWGFDQDHERIVTFYTPRPHRPADRHHWHQTLALVARASKALPVQRTWPVRSGAA